MALAFLEIGIESCHTLQLSFSLHETVSDPALPVDIFPTLEHWLEKPLIPIDIATFWHALRACGIQDSIIGKGRLLEEF